MHARAVTLAKIHLGTDEQCILQVLRSLLLLYNRSSTTVY